MREKYVRDDKEKGFYYIRANAYDGKYKKNTRIEDIYALYYFDDRLRDIILRNILIIEKHIKSLILYSFCETFGENQAAYLDATKYDYTSKKQSGINKLIAN